MSEYQYYEFLAIDAVLSDEDQAAICEISSRVEPTRTRAVFVYNYSDFPRDPTQVLVRYFDAMLYMTNWGSRRLMFRFPGDLIDLEQVQLYSIEDAITFSPIDDYVVIDINSWDDEGGGWVEGEGWLSAVAPLREDILRQDYRLLYLAWLQAVAYYYGIENAGDVYEPPVPPGLKQLTSALRSFIDFFEIDENLVRAAAKTSGRRQTLSADRLSQAILSLSPEERHDFLARLAQGEANLSVKLNRRLHELVDTPQPAAASHRTVSQLFAAAEETYEREKQRLAAEAEATRIKNLESLAQREPQAWREVDALIQRGQAASYEKAVDLLKQLRDLARYQQKEIVFQTRLTEIYDQYSRRSALMRRLRKAGFLE